MKILITDDHIIVREGLKRILSEMVEVKSVDEAADGEEALNMISKRKYDIVLLDISMPGRSGLDILKKIKRNKPSPSVLILSVQPEEQYAIRALKAGAAGYITKDSASEELVKAIRMVYSGRKYISDATTEQLVQDVNEDSSKRLHERLSDREYQIMLMITSGETNKAISEKLGLRIKTISTYRMRILNKMKMKNNSELTYYVIKNELLRELIM